MAGQKTRTDVLNHLASKYNLKRYLEIGVQVPELNFDRINCPYKVGVDHDPRAKAEFCMTSDEFFDTGFETSFVNTDWETKFDLIFLDGLHHCEQVKKDFENAVRILSPNGFICIHDTNPEKEEHTIVPRATERGHWNGSVYKFAMMLAATPGYYTVDVDNGCGIFRKNETVIYNNHIPEWSEFDNNRKELLKLISWDEFITL